MSLISQLTHLGISRPRQVAVWSGGIREPRLTLVWTAVPDPWPESPAPTQAYHFTPPDVEGPRGSLLVHFGGDLRSQASGTVQGSDVQVGADTLRGGGTQ